MLFRSQVDGTAIIVPALLGPPDEHLAWLLRTKCGPESVVSGPVAARLGGWDIPGEEQIVVIPLHRRCSVTGVRILQRECANVLLRDELPLAHPLDAWADTLTSVTWRRSCELVDDALQQRLIDRTIMRQLVAARAGRGRRGATRLRLMLQRVETGARSEAEQRMSRLLRRSMTGKWIANHPIYDDLGRILAEIDFALPELKIAIEVDGRAHHVGHRSFERDRARQNLLVLRGWLVLRFTWEQITNDPAGVIAAIRAAVLHRSSGTSGPSRATSA